MESGGWQGGGVTVDSGGGSNVILTGASLFTLNQWFTTCVESLGSSSRQPRLGLTPDQINHHLWIFLKSQG